jgi:4-diphosphocytidyl-2-C-methyl-D-erythritol kinase
MSIFILNKIDKKNTLSYLFNMLNQMQILAPAKINLYLKVLKKREDGFHNIISLFRKIKLFDHLSITIEPASYFSCKIEGDFDFSDEENLIWKAAELFCLFINRTICFTVTCKKNIPEGSGLGGGSSDAAAMLIAANEMMGRPCGRDELRSLSEELGSDVPFFIDSSSTALITGRGENIRPIPFSDKNYWLVIVYPGFKISSGSAYKQFDSWQSLQTEILDDGETISILSKSICSRMLQTPDTWNFGNDFEKVLFDEYPIYLSIKEHLIQLGAVFTLLTGSGSAYFGMFENKTTAEKAAVSLEHQIPASNKIILCQY